MKFECSLWVILWVYDHVSYYLFLVKKQRLFFWANYMADLKGPNSSASGKMGQRTHINHEQWRSYNQLKDKGIRPTALQDMQFDLWSKSMMNVNMLWPLKFMDVFILIIFVLRFMIFILVLNVRFIFYFLFFTLYEN